VRLILVAVIAAAVATTVTRCSIRPALHSGVDPSNPGPADRTPGPEGLYFSSRSSNQPPERDYRQNAPSVKPADRHGAPVATDAPIESSASVPPGNPNPTEIPGLESAPSPGVHAPPPPSAPPSQSDDFDDPLAAQSDATGAALPAADSEP
jgi:hypothetical protein